MIYDIAVREAPQSLDPSIAVSKSKKQQSFVLKLFGFEL